MSGRVASRSKDTTGRIPARVSIVGAGAVGSTLAALLFEKGFAIVSIVSRTEESALELGAQVKCPTISTSLADVSPETEFLLFTVPDDTLPELVRQSATKLDLRKPLVAHTSGVHTLDVLKSFGRRGALIASMHPIQSFPKSKSLRERVKSVKGIWFGVEAEDNAQDMIEQIIWRLGGRTILLPEGKKALYHAACVFASNYAATLLNAVEEASEPLGFHQRWRDVLLPLFSATTEHVFKTSPREALTGPVARNDVRTIERHLEALQEFAPQLVPLYSVMGIETARLARQQGSLQPDQYREIVRSIRKFVRSFRLPHRSKEKH